MKRYLTKDDAKRITELQIEAYMEAIAMANDIKNVIRKFDGKKITKHIETALKEINSGLAVENGNYGYNISYYPKNRFIETKTNTVYLRNDQIHLGGASKKSSDGKQSLIDDEGRLVAQVLIDEINAQQNYLVRLITRIDEDLSAIDKLIEEHDDLVRRVRKFNESVSGIVQDYYDLYLELR